MNAIRTIVQLKHINTAAVFVVLQKIIFTITMTTHQVSQQ